MTCWVGVGGVDCAFGCGAGEGCWCTFGAFALASATWLRGQHGRQVAPGWQPRRQAPRRRAPWRRHGLAVGADGLVVARGRRPALDHRRVRAEPLLRLKVRRRRLRAAKTSQTRCCLRKGLGSFVSPLPGALRPQPACLPSQASRQRRPVQTHPLLASSTRANIIEESSRSALAMGCGGAPRLTCLRLMDDIAEPSLEAIPPASPAATPPTPSGFFSFAFAPACTQHSRTSDKNRFPVCAILRWCCARFACALHRGESRTWCSSGCWRCMCLVTCQDRAAL